jgi:hypothetical protein
MLCLILFIIIILVCYSLITRYMAIMRELYLEYRGMELAMFENEELKEY